VLILLTFYVTNYIDYSVECVYLLTVISIYNQYRKLRYFAFLFLVGLWFEFRTSDLQSMHSTTWALLPVHFPLVILKMGSLKLFAWAGLKLWSSRCTPSRYLGLLAWAMSTWLHSSSCVYAESSKIHWVFYIPQFVLVIFHMLSDGQCITT
jgi:hypothetical protein